MKIRVAHLVASLVGFVMVVQALPAGAGQFKATEPEAVEQAENERPEAKAPKKTSPPPPNPEWDPKDPAAVQYADGAWGIAYVDNANPPNLFFRRSLGGGDPQYWRDQLTVEPAADRPVMTLLGNTTALFYGKMVGTVREIFLKTSTDDGATWSAPAQLTSGSPANVFQMQVLNIGGTIHLFWSRSDTSGQLSYITSGNLSTWSAPTAVGQLVGPVLGNTLPYFDLVKLASGGWAMTWQNVSLVGNGLQNTANNPDLPVVWFQTFTLTETDLTVKVFAAGKLTSITDRNGNALTLTHDSDAKLTSVSDGAARTLSFAYQGARISSVTDPLNRTVAYGYSPGGDLTSVTDPRGKLWAHTYDSEHRMLTKTDPNNRTVDNLISVKDANNHTRSYTYDKNNRQLTEKDALNNTTTFVYDGAGNRTKRTDAKNQITTYSYDTIDRLTATTYPSGNVTYGYNTSDAQTSMTDSTGTTTYTLDELYRPSSITMPGNKVVGYLYDAAGNRTRITYPDSKQVNYTYDNNGNQTGRGADVFGWDIEDRLTSATVGGNPVSYTYRGDDLRHSKTQAGVTTVFTWDLAAGLPVVLQEGNTTYVYGLGLISQTTASTTSYPLADGLGSTAALTDASGAVTATYKYDVFGAVKSSTGPGSTEFRFAGQQDDPALGYQYLRARYYDPAAGRFISKDPFGGKLNDPSSQNAYPYVKNNPVNMTDPTGRIAFLATMAIGVGIGAVIGGGAGLVTGYVNGYRGKDLRNQALVGMGIGVLAGATLGLGGAGALAIAPVAGFAGSALAQRLAPDYRRMNWPLAMASGAVGLFAGIAGTAMGAIALTETGALAAEAVTAGGVAALFDLWMSLASSNPKHQTAAQCA